MVNETTLAHNILGDAAKDASWGLNQSLLEWFGSAFSDKEFLEAFVGELFFS